MRRCGPLPWAVMAAVALCWGSPAMASRSPKLPEWALAAAATKPGPLPKTANAVVLYQDEVLTVDRRGRAEYRFRQVVKILRPPGREDAVPQVDYDRDAPLKSFHVWSIGPHGHRFAMRKDQYQDIGDEDNSVLYADDRMRVAYPPGADPGGIVAWEFVQKLPSYQSEYTWNFQLGIPVVKAVFQVNLPAGWHDEAKWFRHAAIPATQVAPNQYRWEADHVKGVDLSHVALAPDWDALAARMVLHFSPQPIPKSNSAEWTKIGEWYGQLAAGKTAGGPNIKAAALGLVSPDADFMTRVDRIAAYMQKNIRYVGIEIGIGGWRPHSAREVFQNQYGDCKDKATLMISMLKDVGIRATWVLVDTDRGFVSPTVPSIDGDHVIVAITIPQGYRNAQMKSVVTTRTGQRYLIFDPTNEYVPAGLLPEYLQGGWGLLVAGDDSQVMHLPVLAPSTDVTSWQAHLKLAANGTLTGTAQVKEQGASSWASRQYYAKSTPRQVKDHLNAMLRDDLNQFTLKSDTITNVLALDKPLSIHYDLSAPGYAQVAGSLLLVRPRVLGSVEDELDHKTRNYPISFPELGTWRDSISIAMPPGYTVEDLPDPVHVNLGFADYSSKVEAAGGVLHYTRKYVVKKLTLPASDFAKLRRLEAAIASDESDTVVLRKQ